MSLLQQLFPIKNLSEKTVLGIDGGGTKTHAVLATLDGEKLTEVIVGPTNPAAVGWQEAKNNFQALIEKIGRLQKIPEVVVMGSAGLDTKADIDDFHKMVKPILKKWKIIQFELMNDAQIALYNGTTATECAILIAGTGSICLGKLNDKTHIAGGLDYLLADEGSGYWIGLRLLQHVVRGLDGRCPKDELVDKVFSHLKVENLAELKRRVYNPPMNKAEIASLTKFWIEGLTEDNQFCFGLLNEVVGELEGLVSAVARALFEDGKNWDLVLAGSIALLPAVETRLRARLTALYPKCNIIVPEKPPVWGAVEMGIELQKKTLK